MIDIHTHILPGLDDGARDMDDSLEMAVIAVQSGVHALAATSHANTGGFFSEYSVEEYMKRLSDFRRELDREAIPLTVLSGMEIFMTHEVPDMIREEDCCRSMRQTISLWNSALELSRKRWMN